MYTPNIPSWVQDRSHWDDSPSLSKKLLFRIIIDPVDTIYTWWWHNVSRRIDRAENAIMRIKKGYDWSDQWNINQWFISTIVPMLDYWLEKGPMGNPVCDDEDGKEMTYEKWVEYLTEMRDGFKLWLTYETEFPEVLPPDGVEIIKSKDHESCYHNGAHYMTFDSVWNKCCMDNDERKKFERAMVLFSKYMEAMWD